MQSAQFWDKTEVKLENAVYLFDFIVKYDPITAMHCCNTSNIATALATKLDFSGLKLLDLSLAAQLHDIGKIKVPSAILNKSGPLTEEEYEIVKKHSKDGFMMIKNVPQFQELAETILYHHEKFDGSGYPTGKKGEEIPVFSRIISIADAYEAMISDRSYRKALSTKAALDIICHEKNSYFDPMLVDVFIAMLLEKNNKSIS